MMLESMKTEFFVIREYAEFNDRRFRVRPRTRTCLEHKSWAEIIVRVMWRAHRLSGFSISRTLMNRTWECLASFSQATWLTASIGRSSDWSSLLSSAESGIHSSRPGTGIPGTERDFPAYPRRERGFLLLNAPVRCSWAPLGLTYLPDRPGADPVQSPDGVSIAVCFFLDRSSRSLRIFSHAFLPGVQKEVLRDSRSTRFPPFV